MAGVCILPQMFEQIRKASGWAVVPEMVMWIDDGKIGVDDVFIDLSKPFCVGHGASIFKGHWAVILGHF